MLPEQLEWLRVTLASIGDAVITTDTHGSVTFMNQVAQRLTGWSHDEACGQPLEAVFNIVNEETLQVVESPATRALREGVIVGLANHTLLLAKDGAEHAIDDSAAPIRDRHGQVGGVVLVFRDVTERRRDERRLRESEERFRLLVESVKDYAIFMLDPHGIVSSWNAGAEQIKGFRADEIIGKHFSRFYPPEAIATGFPETELKTAAAVGRFEDENWRIRKDGSRFWANVVITALRDPTGRLKGFAKVTRDLTERRAMEEALRSREKYLRALMQSAHDAIIAANSRGAIVSWNSAAASMFGYNEAEALGQPLEIIMPQRFHEAHRKGMERLRQTGESRLIGKTVELVGRHKNGTEFSIELSLATWHTDEGDFYSGIIRDIAERKQLERAKLQSEVLADLNRRKDEFLAMLSHELRNPLAPISTTVQLLRQKKDDETAWQQAMPILERQVSHLTRLVDDLLDVSRISTGRIRLQLSPIDLRRVAQRAVDAVHSLIRQRSHEFSLALPDGHVLIHADPVRIEQVIVNLLTNAAKYTNLGGKIRLAVESSGDEAVVRVTDTGVGISPELLPNVFDLFTQADRSLDRSQGGLGVGLTIVQRIAELHGGKAEAHSAGPGRGSEFVVRLPLTAPPAGETPVSSKSAVAVDPKPLNVLVVDDNKDAANSLALLLRQAGHDTLTAYSGASALALASENVPDVVLLDLGMPELDGYDVARLIRKKRPLKHVRLIALTGYGRDDDRQRSQEAGFDAHLVKPVEPQKLRDLLATLASK
jgi:PAS domain S-box-containing protein